MEKRLKRLIMLLLIFILIALNIWIFISNNMSKKTSQTDNRDEDIVTYQENTVISENTIDDKIKSKVSKMDEISRAKFYCGKFMEAIENKNYELAYSYLNETYKSNYFRSLDEFKSYMENKYPKNGIIVKYNSTDKKGEVFVLDITVNDEDDPEFKEFNQSIVIREISLNNFSISFSKDDERGERRK